VLLTIGSMIVVLGVLIFVHELGHFLAAKSVGIAVLRFSLGFGPRTPLTFRRGETEYCLSWLPLGGYVKMAGLEDEGAAGGIEGPRESADIPAERTFDGKPLWARILVISAGVAMNALFAVVVYTGLTYVYGVAEDPSVTVGEVATGNLPMGAGQVADLHPGDRILRVNGDTIRQWSDFQEALVTAASTPLRIEVAGRAEPVLVDVPLSKQEDRLALVQAIAPWHEPVIGEVVPGRPAALAGIERGDRIVAVDGDTVPAWERFVHIVEQSAGESLAVTVLRQGALHRLTLVPEEMSVPGPSGTSRRVGKVGLAVYLPLTRYGVVGSIGQGLQRTASSAGLIVFTLKGLVLGQVSPRDLGGPILVGQLSGEMARLGLDAFLSFMALFSVNLAVLNLLPIPVLDGGHLVFLVVEGIRRRPLSIVQRQRLTQVGFFVLVAIMALAIANDVTRLFQKLF